MTDLLLDLAKLAVEGMDLDLNPFGDEPVKDKEENQKDKKKDKKKKKDKHKKKEAELEYGNEPDTEYEMSLFQTEECFLYQVPPGQIKSGYKSADWGLGKPLFTGKLKVMERGKIMFFAFEKDGKLFLKGTDIDCTEVGNKRPKEYYIQKVQDSSRYFVFKVMDPRSKRLVNFGVGFRERDRAFDFEAVFQSKVDQVHRDAALAKELAEEEAKEEKEGDSGGISDFFALKGPITVATGSKDGKKKKKKAKDSGGVVVALGGLSLAPPPTGEEDVSDDDYSKKDDAPDEDDWGDFSAA